MTLQVVSFGASDDPHAPDARMSVSVWVSAPSDRLAVIAHGRNGAANAPHMMKLIDVYRARGYIVVSPDCCASAWNEAAGEERDFLLADHVRDVRRAIEWAEDNAATLGWSGEHLVLAGHSMGAYAVAHLAATDWHGRIGHLVLVSPFTSGTRQIEAREKYHPDGIANLRRDVPAALDEWPRHDIFTVIDKLTLPTAVIAGAKDIVAPPENVREFVERLPTAPAFLMLPEASHCLEGGDYAAELGGIVGQLDAAAGFVDTAKAELSGTS